MPNRAVSIYERVKGHTKQTWRPVEIPARQKPLGGGLYLKDNRRGDFYISWYEGRRERFKKVKGGLLNLAISAAEAKTWELVHPDRVKEEVPDDERLTIAGGVYRYLEQMAGSNLTIKEHRHALEEFQRWTSSTFVEQITRAELLRFKDYLQRTRKNTNSLPCGSSTARPGYKTRCLRSHCSKSFLTSQIARHLIVPRPMCSVSGGSACNRSQGRSIVCPVEYSKSGCISM